MIREDATHETGGHPPTRSSIKLDLVSVLGAALQDEDHDVRTQAICGLAYMNNEEVLPLLINALKHPDYSVKHYACMGLGWLGRAQSNRAAVVSALRPLCDDNQVTPFDLRFDAACVLFEMGELHSATVFVEALRTTHARSTIVAKAIARFDRKDAILLLIKQMASLPPGDANIFGKSLQALTGKQLGGDPVEWYRWFETNRASLPEQMQ